MKPLQPDTLICNPNGRPIVASVLVDCHATRLWDIVGQFAGFDAFIPDLTHIEMTGTGVGALRTKFFRDGNCVVEQLNSRDEQAMHMTWTTIYNTLCGRRSVWRPLAQTVPKQHGRSLPSPSTVQTQDLNNLCRASPIAPWKRFVG